MQIAIKPTDRQHILIWKSRSSHWCLAFALNGVPITGARRFASWDTAMAYARHVNGADSATLRCSSEGCDAPATETLFLRDQVGHVHDCPQHAHDVREWCDVVHSAPIIDGECLAAVFCTSNDPIWTGMPTPLPGADS